MERFVGRQNIEHYRAMIKNATDLERRGVFKRLLRDEEAKLKKYEEDRKENLSIGQTKPLPTAASQTAASPGDEKDRA